MSRYSADDVTRLHGHSIGADGAPSITERFLTFLDSPHRTGDRGSASQPAPIPLAQAWTRLHAEEPHLAAAVEQTVVHKLTVRDAAPALGLSFATVARHKRAGIAALVVWTGLPAPSVARQVCTL